MVEIKYLGHSFFLITSESGVRIAVDPYITGNPKCPIKPEELECDYILVTHGHGDHLGDAIPVAKRTGATLVAIHEITQYASSRGVEKIINMNFGGTVEEMGVSFTLVPAMHSSGISEVDFGFDGGFPGGFVIGVDDKRIYHAGDTDVFSDMKIIGELYKPDVALLPIGDRFTMGAIQAAYATWLLSPAVVIPMHWGTFPVIEQSPDRFAAELEAIKKDKGFATELRVLQPGERTQM